MFSKERDFNRHKFMTSSAYKHVMIFSFPLASNQGQDFTSKSQDFINQKCKGVLNIFLSEKPCSTQKYSLSLVRYFRFLFIHYLICQSNGRNSLETSLWKKSYLKKETEQDVFKLNSKQVQGDPFVIIFKKMLIPYKYLYIHRTASCSIEATNQ